MRINLYINNNIHIETCRHKIIVVIHKFLVFLLSGADVFAGGFPNTFFANTSSSSSSNKLAKSSLLSKSDSKDNYKFDK